MLPVEPTERRRAQQLVFTAGLFGVMLTFPLLAAWDQDARIGGMPVLFVALVSIWGALVAFTGWFARKPVADLTTPPEAPADTTPAPDRRV